MGHLESKSLLAAVEDGVRYHLLDADDLQSVAAFERNLYDSFHRFLAINPLVRDLWIWDEENGRLRTHVGYEKQIVALMSDESTGRILFSVGVNTDIDAFWQSAAYGFGRPPASERACEFLILAGAQSNGMTGARIIRRFIRDYFFGALLDAGFDVAYATTADHMRRVYGWIGAESVEERQVSGFRRTLIRWDLRGLRARSDAAAV